MIKNKLILAALRVMLAPHQSQRGYDEKFN